MGGEQLEDMRCSKEGAFQFLSVSELDSVRTHSDAMRSVFRSPRTRSVSGPRGTVQLVSGGLQGWGEWGEAWNRDAAATAAYLRVFLPRPRSLVQVDFMKGTEHLQFACDQCFTHASKLSERPELQRQVMDFWHKDCTSYRCPRCTDHTPCSIHDWLSTTRDAPLGSLDNHPAKKIATVALNADAAFSHPF